MYAVRKSEERGHANHGWLQAKHSFSFADYYDPGFMGFRSLRVINEDRVAEGMGFPTHGHRDMEILTYVISGALEHKDSMGNGSIIRPGEIQYMSAGSGVRHSEYNPLDDQPLHLMQIWIMPRESDLGATPRYDQKNFPREEKLNRLRLLASPDGKDGSIAIRQDANLYAAILEKDQTLTFSTRPERGVWVQVIRGQLEVNGQKLKAGDALAASQLDVYKLQAAEETEFLLFDLD